MEGKGKGATRLFLRGGIHEKGKRAWLFIFDVYINSISRAKASEQLHFRWTWTLFRCGDCGRQLYGQNEIADWRLFRSSWSFHSCSHPWFRSLPSIRRIFLPSCSSRFKFHPRIRFRVNAFFFFSVYFMNIGVVRGEDFENCFSRSFRTKNDRKKMARVYDCVKQELLPAMKITIFSR